MTDFKIRKGYQVPIKGEAKKEIENLAQPPFVGVCPVAFEGVKPKLSVKVNDDVKVGTPLFFDKKAEDVKFLSPASGRVTAINYGPRRVIEEIVIATSGTYDYEAFPSHSQAEIGGMDRETLIAELMQGGVWPYIRQRPYNRIADPANTPKAVFVNCMDSSPLANDPAFSLEGKSDAFNAGIQAMRVLCDNVHVCADGKDTEIMFSQPEGIQFHTFRGKHPAGLTGTHINRIDPINKGQWVWHIHARDLVMVGSLLLTGKYPIERVIAVAGPSAQNARYYRGQLGMKMQDILKDNPVDDDIRIISGNVLNGHTKRNDAFLDFYDDLVTLLPEGGKPVLLGWMGPGINKTSITPAFLSALMPNKRFDLDTSINGGHRAIIASGVYDKVVALDIFPEFLIKATIAQDIDAMERLGILECDPEDFALATYVCPSKTEVSQIIAEGLELMEKEG